MRPDPYKQACSRRYKKEHNIPDTKPTISHNNKIGDEDDASPQSTSSSKFSRRRLYNNAIRYQEQGDETVFEDIIPDMPNVKVTQKSSITKGCHLLNVRLGKRFNPRA
jgi:hypothetical protein